MTDTTLDKIVRIGKGTHGSIYCRIKWDGRRLSISGVEGPLPSGNARGGAGQIVMGGWHVDTFAPGWDADTERRFIEVWNRWHLNDMRASCEHQRDWGDEELEVVSYKLTDEARSLRKQAEQAATAAAVENQPANLTPTMKALLACKWWEDINQPPDADSPLSGMYEVSKREKKRANWVKESEHPRGVLGKPCPVCGYKFGTAWRTEEVPADVIEFLESLPETDTQPAWC